MTDLARYTGVPDSSRETIRTLSEQVFGNRHRLEVLAAIAAGEEQFYIHGLSEQTHIPDTTIAAIVKRLDDRLVLSFDRLSSVGPRYYQRCDHPIWRLALSLLETLETTLQADEHSRAGRSARPSSRD